MQIRRAHCKIAAAPALYLCRLDTLRLHTQNPTHLLPQTLPTCCLQPYPLAASNPTHLLPQTLPTCCLKPYPLAASNPTQLQPCTTTHADQKDLLDPFEELHLLKPYPIAATAATAAPQVFDVKQGVFQGTCGSVIRRKWLDVRRERRKQDEL
jgi:hypothetical protein